MEKALPDRKILTQYLLGELSDPEQLGVVEQYFGDEELYDLLLSVEAELLDKLVRGELDAGKHEKFTAYLNKLPGGKEKLAFAYSLKHVVVQELAAKSPARTEIAQTSFGQRILVFIRKPAFSISLAAGLLVAAGFLIWLMIHQREITSDIENLREQVAKREMEASELQGKLLTLEKGLQTNGESIEKLSGDLEQERLKSDEQALEIARLREQPPPFDVWALTTPRKGFGSPDKVTLHQGRKFVKIEIPIGDDEPEGSYSLVLQTEDGQQVLQERGLHIISSSKGKKIVARIDADKFKETAYKITLVAPDGISFEYYFKVTKQ